MTDCLFCKMISGDIQPDVVFESEDVLAFRDINPQAPTHVLIIPKIHITAINDLDASHEVTVGKLYTAAKQIAHEEGISNTGYRVVMNCGEDAGQSVLHIHLHLLGGRHLAWPPG